MKTLLIRVLLPQPRTRLGSLVLLDDGTTLFGPVEAYGKADNRQAAARGNPTRDPTLPFGDVPLGVYDSILASLPSTAANNHKFGPHGFIALDPVSGPALAAKQNGRHGLLIHGGDFNAAGKLRPTFGCLRLANPNMQGLVEILKTAGAVKLRCEIGDQASTRRADAL